MSPIYTGSAEGLVDLRVYAASVAVGFMMSSNSTGVSFPSHLGVAHPVGVHVEGGEAFDDLRQPVPIVQVADDLGHVEALEDLEQVRVCSSSGQRSST